MATKFANLAVRESEQLQVKQMKHAMENPLVWSGVPNKEDFKKKLRLREEKLARITPPDLKGDEVLKVKQRHDLLKSAMLEGKQGMVPPMPSRREMEQAPSGAVDKHLNFEMFWKRHNLDPEGHIRPIARGVEQNLLHELKDTMRTLGKSQEEYSPNIANLDIYRPEVANVSLADSVLPRSFGGTSPQFKENYDAAFPDHKPTPVERKLRVAKTPCVATKKSGEPCKSSARSGSPFCAFHRHLEPVLDAPITTEAPNL